MPEPNKWHKTGVLMSIAALVAVIAMAVWMESSLPMWEQVTRHSDHPEQFSRGLDGLESEIDFRIAELEFARDRAYRKADDCRRGIPESGEETTPAKVAELQARAPEWQHAAEHADEILKRLRTPSPGRTP